MGKRYDENGVVEYTICKINFKDTTDIKGIFKESITQKSELSNLGKCEIKVYGNEGKFPHFHIVNNKGFNCCVCINDARYFTHGSKDDRLTNQQAKELYDIMKSKSALKGFEGKSVWKVTQMAWVLANDDSNIILRKRPPKYSDLNKYDSIHE